MSTRGERDKQKALQEKHQAILAKLLKDDDNKYCVDCDAKGPRWASWNLGIFLCIRCAGIHRNLGVHISKVKSVNLDTWTPEQIAMMEEMGNSRARAVYEANLPDHVRRPQSDSSLEAFIRAKYEQKKYIAKEWVPPRPKVPTTVIDEPRKEKKKSRSKQASLQLGAPQSKSSPVNSKTESVARPKAKVEIVQKESNIADLLSLDDPAPSSNGPSTADDIFESFVQAPSSSTTSAQHNTANVVTTNQQQQQQTNSINSTSSSSDLVEALFGEESQGGDSQKNTKDSIMALFGNQQQQQSNQQIFGVPGGMYMQQPGMPQQQTQINMMGGMQNGMMPNNMMAAGMVPNANMMQQPQANMQYYQNGQQQSNLMTVDPVAALKSNIAVQQSTSIPYANQPNNLQWDQMAAMAAMQNNMMGGMMMGGMHQQHSATGMMGGQQGMMMQQPQSNMYNNMGFMQQQPPTQHMNQMQNQMAGLNLGGGSSGVGSFQQAGAMASTGWATQQTGQTLSTNLWQ